MATLPKVVTYEEWIQMPATEGREEVVEGEIRRLPPKKLPHPVVIDNLTAVFHAHLNRARAVC